LVCLREREVNEKIDHVMLCVYERRHGTFYTLGNRAIGPIISPTGAPTRKYKIGLKDLRDIIEYAERTGEPE
jgi:hypothetical protein